MDSPAQAVEAGRHGNPARTGPYQPRSVFWEVTNRCNLSCEHCYNKNYLNDKTYRYSLPEGLERCRKIVAAGFEKVVFLGGEPFADKNLLTYIQVLQANGAQCSISTNATLITPEVARDIALIGVKLVNVSLDGGTAEVNDPVRGEGTFERIVAGIRNLAENRRENLPRISLAYTLAAENHGDYRDLFELAKRFEIVDIFFNKFLKVNESSLKTDPVVAFLQEMDRICTAARSVGDFYIYLPTMPRVADALSARHGFRVFAKEKTCSAVDEAVLLADDGKIYPCSMARVAHQDYAVALGEHILDTLDQEPMQRFIRLREDMRSRLPKVCTACHYSKGCATRCVLTGDQSKYFLGCEAIENKGASIFSE